MARTRYAALLASIIGLAGCVGPPALRQSVLGYDETVARLDQDILLLNIARLSKYDPPHFTVTSSIAATFNFETGGSIGGSVFEGAGTDLLSLNIESRASENPTFSIVPVAGREFTERVLQPFGENVFAFFAFQGVRIELLGRLMADSIEIDEGGGGPWRKYENRVSKWEDFYRFRQILLHLGALQSRGQLWFTRLTYDQTILSRARNQPSTDDIANGLARGLTWEENDDGTYKLTRRVAGRVLISDYDPRSKPPEELRRLDERAGRMPDNFVLVDVEDGRVGDGAPFPIRGAFLLRSLFSILDFVAKSIELFEEQPVPPDPRSGRPAIDERNPVSTITVRVSDERPSDGSRWIEYNGRFYILNNQKWDLQAFTILYELFQVTLSDVNRIGIPVTIAK